MTTKRIGTQTIKFTNPPSIIGTASIVGPKEGEGPLKNYFDLVLEDDTWGEKTFEKAESKIQEEAIKLAISNANLSVNDIQFLISGDLLAQTISSSFTARQIGIPHFGLYGACSTMSESLCLGAMIVEGGFADKVVCATSSHFSSAERQFRFPLEYGAQRKFSASWTVTGGGATVLSSVGDGPYITYITPGKVIDYGIIDTNNMGGAMAPAAIDTISQHFKDTGYNPSDYDLIITGDLGLIGKKIVTDLMKKEGYDLSQNYSDCGVKIYDGAEQDTHAGGSGCACSAVVFNGYIYKEMKKGNLNRVLLVSTGALHSPTSSLQGESVPGVAHAVTIDNLTS